MSKRSIRANRHRPDFKWLLTKGFSPKGAARIVARTPNVPKRYPEWRP